MNLQVKNKLTEFPDQSLLTRISLRFDFGRQWYYGGGDRDEGNAVAVTK